MKPDQVIFQLQDRLERPWNLQHPTADTLPQGAKKSHDHRRAADASSRPVLFADGTCDVIAQSI